LARVGTVIYINKGVSIYLRPGSPCWQLRISRYGHRTRESLNTDDLEAAKAIAHRRADQLHSQAEGVVIPRNVSYADLLVAYKEHAELRNTPATRKLNYDNLERIVRFLKKRLGGSRELLFSDFNLAAITAYATARRKDDIKPATINREIGTLSAFFTAGKKAKLIRGNPVADFDPMPVPKNRTPETLTPVQAYKLLEAAGEPVELHGRGQKGQGNTRARFTPIHDLIEFMLNTGARLAEAMYLEWKDIDLNARLIRFSNKPEHTLKDYEDRALKGNDPVMAMLNRRKIRAGGIRWVFPAMEGTVLDRKNLLRELKAAAKKAKIQKVNFLILRHTALTAWARSGMSPFALKELAGHATVRTSERYYIGLVGGDGWIPPAVGE
jgi:integrase